MNAIDKSNTRLAANIEVLKEREKELIDDMIKTHSRPPKKEVKSKPKP